MDRPGALDEIGRYGYLSFELPFAAEIVHDSYPVRTATTVGNYATDYIVLKAAPEGDGGLRFDFAGAAETRLADAPIPVETKSYGGAIAPTTATPALDAHP